MPPLNASQLRRRRPGVRCAVAPSSEPRAPAIGAYYDQPAAGSVQVVNSYAPLFWRCSLVGRAFSTAYLAAKPGRSRLAPGVLGPGEVPRDILASRSALLGPDAST